MVAASYGLGAGINQRFIIHGPQGILFHEAVKRYCSDISDKPTIDQHNWPVLLEAMNLLFSSILLFSSTNTAMWYSYVNNFIYLGNSPYNFIYFSVNLMYVISL